MSPSVSSIVHSLFRRLTLTACFPFAFMLLISPGLLAQTVFPTLAASRAVTSTVSQPRARATLIDLPLIFETNSGQTDTQAKFISRGPGYMLFLTNNEAVFALSQPASTRQGRIHPLTSNKSAPRQANVNGTNENAARSVVAQSNVFQMKLVGANTVARLLGVDEQPGKSNYFIGNDPKKWRTGVPNYTRVKYEEIYPGINLIYYGNQRQLEYDFVLAPGANPRAIELRMAGSSMGTRMTGVLEMDANGDLIVRNEEAEAHLHKPIIYQTSQDGRRIPIKGGYRVRENGDVGFEIDAYDPAKTLVIDPTIAFSTYLGGSGFDRGAGIAEDRTGNVYITGSTSSPNFPVVNALQGTLNGTTNAFVTKFSADGSTLVYSTYVGGTSFDDGFGIAVDSSGQAYVAGETDSTDFPTMNAFQKTKGTNEAGQTNGFVFQLSADGSTLLYSTYLGGSGLDQATAIAADNTGHAYVTGQTSSFNFPTTKGAVQFFYQNDSTNPLGPYDAFVSVIATTLTGRDSLIYSTYLGGSDTDFGVCIALDNPSAPAANIYVTGGSFSTDFPILNGFQTSNAAGKGLAFLTELSLQGSAYVITYSTYFGGDGATGYTIVAQEAGVFEAGEVGVAGFTTTNLPVKNAIQGTFGGGDQTTGPLEDGFVAWFYTGASGEDSLLASTYFGGSGNDSVKGISGCCGEFWITGFTDSPNLPVSANALQPVYGGNVDAFVAHIGFGDTPPTLLYSSYLGGNGLDSGEAIAGNTGFAGGSIYVTGYTCPTTDGGASCGAGSDNFPTKNAVQGSLAGAQNAFLTKITLTPDFSILPISPINVAVGGAGSTTVTVQSIDEYSDETVKFQGLGLAPSTSPSTLPTGWSWLMQPSAVEPRANGTASATLTVNVDPVTTPATYSLLLLANPPQHIAPVAVNVTATTMGVMAIISTFQSTGCIDNSGIAGALTNKLSAAQANADAGQVKAAINTENALLNQIQAQSGKHIALSCTVNTSTVSPPLVLSNDVRALIANLKLVGTADPILGYVINSNNSAVAGATLGLFDSSSSLRLTTATDNTGFYYFANTTGLTPGATYIVKVISLPNGYSMSSPASQNVTWGAAAVSLPSFTAN